MRENTRSPKKKLLAAGMAVALGAGMVGVGANWDYVTSVIGNQFNATVADPDATQRDRALLQISGDAIEKNFDVAINNDFVTADWTITNIGERDAQFAADFLPAVAIDEVLAENLEVFYSVDGGQERRAGTMADSAELTAVTGLSDVLAKGESVDVQVRIVLPNPGELLIDGENEIGDRLSVVADWNVDYLTVGGYPEETPAP